MSCYTDKSSQPAQYVHSVYKGDEYLLKCKGVHNQPLEPGRPLGEWIPIDHCFCSSCVYVRRQYRIKVDYKNVTPPTRVVREQLRMEKQYFGDMVWAEWGWMRREFAKDLLTLGFIGAAGYILLYQRLEAVTCAKLIAEKVYSYLTVDPVPPNNPPEGTPV